MRHPQLTVRLLKGSSINPRLKMFSSNKNSNAHKVHKLADEMTHLTISRGVGVSDRKIRRPLKFLM